MTMPFDYKALVIPSGMVVSDRVWDRVVQLSKQGVQVLTKPYEGTQLNVAPDAVLPEGIAYTHRTSSDEDIYFLSNQTDKEQTFKPVFRQKRDNAFVYNPLTDLWTDYDGTITLQPYGSLFVCYEQNAVSRVEKGRFSDRETPFHPESFMKKPWTISFRESGVTMESQQFFDWSKHENEKIRYFSGHARYSAMWKLKKKEVPMGRVWLSFPNVKDIAHVWINGKDCGIAWTAPYEVEITGALKKGKNTIEIEVVNTWHNALRGADQGKAPYEGIWTNAKYRTTGDGLLPAGIIEPPVLKIE